MIALAFVLILVLFAAVEIAARRSRIPTLADLCVRLLAYEVWRVPVGRLVLIGLWWWVGWHFLAR
ncbi:DUF6186 family protein [Phytohabitans rumicis]|uniref:Uncharacterized protein n=1 Tax=Phytohabitans rumicis TaxID=1076125 RepID=A0A6V8L037_9ACTN|nr:DUF6186 family protein [Phytohabitans rumicis]GFJ88950.1 hypothetical protein Prum_025920 [Phytohabitans rumicis]